MIRSTCLRPVQVLGLSLALSSTALFAQDPDPRPGPSGPSRVSSSELVERMQRAVERGDLEAARRAAEQLRRQRQAERDVEVARRAEQEARRAVEAERRMRDMERELEARREQIDAQRAEIEAQRAVLEDQRRQMEVERERFERQHIEEMHARENELRHQRDQLRQESEVIRRQAEEIRAQAEEAMQQARIEAMEAMERANVDARDAAEAARQEAMEATERVRRGALERLHGQHGGDDEVHRAIARLSDPESGVLARVLSELDVDVSEIAGDLTEVQLELDGMDAQIGSVGELIATLEESDLGDLLADVEVEIGDAEMELRDALQLVEGADLEDLLEHIEVDIDVEIEDAEVLLETILRDEDGREVQGFIRALLDDEDEDECDDECEEEEGHAGFRFFQTEDGEHSGFLFSDDDDDVAEVEHGILDLFETEGGLPVRVFRGHHGEAGEHPAVQLFGVGEEGFPTRAILGEDDENHFIVRSDDDGRVRWVTREGVPILRWMDVSDGDESDEPSRALLERFLRSESDGDSERRVIARRTEVSPERLFGRVLSEEVDGDTRIILRHQGSDMEFFPGDGPDHGHGDLHEGMHDLQREVREMHQELRELRRLIERLHGERDGRVAMRILGEDGSPTIVRGRAVSPTATGRFVAPRAATIERALPAEVRARATAPRATTVERAVPAEVRTRLIAPGTTTTERARPTQVRTRLIVPGEQIDGTAPLRGRAILPGAGAPEPAVVPGRRSVRTRVRPPAPGRVRIGRPFRIEETAPEVEEIVVEEPVIELLEAPAEVLEVPSVETPVEVLEVPLVETPAAPEADVPPPAPVRPRRATLVGSPQFVQGASRDTLHPFAER
ncbi:MAG: hypothetical protein AAF196_19040 [Planctomycetota bacterium]